MGSQQHGTRGNETWGSTKTLQQVHGVLCEQDFGYMLDVDL